MGYARYTLPDGREAGYAVRATCDYSGCRTEIDRGLGYLCGRDPDGFRDPEEFGCGRYFCEKHALDATAAHDCPNPPCRTWDDDEDMCCSLARGHDDEHFSEHAEAYFTTTTEGGEQE